MVNETIEVNKDGLIVLGQVPDKVIDAVSYWFGFNLRLKNVVIGYEQIGDSVGCSSPGSFNCSSNNNNTNNNTSHNEEMAKLLAHSIVSWTDSVNLIKDPVPESIISSMVICQRLDMGFYLKQFKVKHGFSKKDKLIHCLVCYNADGFSMEQDEIRQILSIEEESSQQAKEQKLSLTISLLSSTTVYNQLVNFFLAMIFTPALQLIQCSDMKFGFICEYKCSVDFISACSDYYSFQIEFLNTGSPRKGASVGTNISENLTKNQLSSITELSNAFSDISWHQTIQSCRLNEISVVFHIGDNGQRLSAATVARNTNTAQLLTDSDISLLLAWWAIVRYRYQVDSSNSKKQMPERSKNSSIRAGDTEDRPCIVIDSPVSEHEYICNMATRANVDVVERSHNGPPMLTYIKHRFESRKAKTIFVCNCKEKRYLADGRAWDPVFIAMQLIQVAIFARAISRFSIRRLLSLLKYKYGHNASHANNADKLHNKSRSPTGSNKS